MTSFALAVLVGMLVAGVVLFFVGKRGRRLNRNPVCRDCGFDLVGAYPGVVTCPECGSGLKRVGAVRVGVRRRMVSLMAVGALMVLLALAPLGVTVYAGITGANINPSKPTWLLLMEARWSNANAADLIGKELLDRMVTKKIAPAEYGPLVEAALARQADRSMSWSDSWGDIVERAATDSVLSPEQRASFEKNAVVFTLESRPRVVRGEPLPLFIGQAEQRVCKNTNAYCQVFARSVKLDGVSLKRVASATYPGMTVKMTDALRKQMMMQPVGYVQLFGGAAAAWAQRALGEAAVGATVPADAKLGPAMVEVDVGYTADLLSGNSGTGANAATAVMRGLALGSNGLISGGTDVLGRQKVTLRVPVEIVDGASAPGAVGVGVEVIPADEQMTTRMGMVMRPSVASAQEMSWGGRGGKPRSWMTIQFTLDKDLPAVAHMAKVRVDGKLLPAGEVVSELHVGAAGNAYGYQETLQRTLTLQVEKDVDELPKTVDLVLTPRPELAKLTRSMSKVYGGTIEIKDIGVTVYDPSGNAAKRKTAKEKKAAEEAKEKSKDGKSGEGDGAKEKAGE